MSLERNDRFTLVEALDRLINKGVSLSGDVSISVADIDLVYVGLRVLLCPAERVPELRGSRHAPSTATATIAAPEAAARTQSSASAIEARPQSIEVTEQPESAGDPRPQRPRDVLDVASPAASPHAPSRLMDIDPTQIERDLCRLVLTIVELLRQLMEKQAIRRMEGSTLDDEEVERLGMAFARLDEKMEELRTVFGLTKEDLNIDLGPLGTLV